MHTKRRAWWRLAAAVLALGLVAAACGNNDSDSSPPTDSSTTSIRSGEIGNDDDQASEPEYGGKIVVGVETETNHFDPKLAELAAPGSMIALTFFDPLVAIDAEGNFEPFLAESLEANDDLTEWTLTLREGVQFHDGTPLDAEALKWNWDNLHFAEGARNRGGLVNAGVTGMEIVDDMTVMYTLSGPNAGFPDQLRTYPGLPVSPTAYEADPEGFGNHPVGTGPFEFVSWTRDDRLVVKRNENYWLSDSDGNQLPYLDEIEFRVIPDDESRTASLASDDIQVIQTLRGPSIKRVLAMVDKGGFEASLYIGNESSITVINTLSPPLDDIRIRRALAFANDSEAMAKVRDDDGLTPPANGFFSEDSPWYSAEAVADYPGANGPDPEAAKELVEQYRNDPERSDNKPAGADIEIEYICQPDPTLLQGAQLLQNLWGNVGIDVHLVQLDQATMISRVVGTADTDPPFRGDFQTTCFRASGGEGDPFTNLRGYFGPVETTAGNFSNLTDPRIDEALTKFRETTDFAERYAAIEEVSRVTSELVPYIWNVGTPTLVGYREDVVGIPDWTFPDGTKGNGTPGSIARFTQAYIEK